MRERLKGIGGGYFLIGAVVAFLAVIWLIMGLDKARPTFWDSLVALLPGLVVAGASLPLFALAFLLGTGMFRPRRSIFWLAVYGLLAFPIGTALSAYLLHLMETDKGRRAMES